LDPPEATNKRSRDAEGEAEDGEAASLLSSIQIALFLNGRKDLKKPVANDELRKYLKSEHNVTHKIPKAALKSTLKQVVTARLKKSAKTKPDSKDAKAGAEQEKTPENYMKGDWKCPNCANHNYAKRKECMKCSAPHPDSAAAKKAFAAKNATAKTEKVKGEGDWLCSLCTNRNFANRKKCNKCSVPKAECAPQPVAPIPSAPESETAAAAEEKEQEKKSTKQSVWDAKTLLTKAQVEEYVQMRDHDRGPLTAGELRDHMLHDLHMNEQETYNKIFFANTLRAAVEVSRKHHKRVKKEQKGTM